jgi:GDP-D-mannose 3', 5'-epimerase
MTAPSALTAPTPTDPVSRPVRLSGCRALVTGGAGFIGSSLVRRLVSDGAKVQVIDNLWRGRMENLNGGDSKSFDVSRDFHLADLTDYGRCLELIRDVDIVYHLADVVAGVDYVFNNESFVFRQNILINSNVLSACVTNGIKSYVYVGTACSFPRALQDVEGIAALREQQTYPAEPESAYGWGKLMGEYEAELAQKSHNMNVGLLRFHNVIGPGSSFEPKRSQVIPSLIRKAVMFPEEDYVVWGSGQQYRDFVYVDDVVEALVLVSQKGMNEGVIQIGSEKAITIREAAETIIDLSGKSIDLRFDTSKPEGDRGRIGICDRARDILGWQPRVSFRAGVTETYKWIQREIEGPDHV